MRSHGELELAHPVFRLLGPQVLLQGLGRAENEVGSIWAGTACSQKGEKGKEPPAVSHGMRVLSHGWLGLVVSTAENAEKSMGD